MKICSKCVLPETFPGIVFDENGICNHCKRHALVSSEKRIEQKQTYLDKFMDICEANRNQGAYDALMAYSGGKDSTFTLKYLVDDLGLRVLALTFDHGFISPQAKENMLSVTRGLGVNHIYFLANPGAMITAFRQSVEKDIYPIKALERASAICNTCMHVAKALILKTAVEQRIHIIAYGWSPGQAPVQSSVMRLNAPMIEKTQNVMKESLERVMGDHLKSYLLDKNHLKTMSESAQDGKGFYNVHPLAFLEYREEKMVATIKELGWRPPQDTDSNSSNCLMNTFANQVHLDKYNFHPYAMENAGLVRSGYLNREEALERLNQPMERELSEYLKKTLNIT